MPRPKSNRDLVRTAFKINRTMRKTLIELTEETGRSLSMLIEDLMKEVVKGSVDDFTMKLSKDDRVIINITVDKGVFKQAKDKSDELHQTVTTLLHRAFLIKHG